MKAHQLLLLLSVFVAPSAHAVYRCHVTESSAEDANTWECQVATKEEGWANLRGQCNSYYQNSLRGRAWCATIMAWARCESAD